jgi:MFS family permease
MKSRHAPPSTLAAVGTVAVATVLNPLNTSMIAVALSELGRVFGVSASASTWLVSAFALASAVGHPLAGRLADGLGPRRVLVAGLVIAGASGLAASYAVTFPVLVALRALLALGTSTTFPAGVGVLRSLEVPDGSNRPVPAGWLGAVAMSGNLSAALGPVVGGSLIATAGWRAIFLVNVPIAIAGIGLALRHLPADPDPGRRAPEVSVRRGTLATRGPLLSVYARFAMACVVFFSFFFALPLWLEHVGQLSAAMTGLMVLPLAGGAALATPFAIWTVSRAGTPRALVVGAGGLCLGAALLTTVGVQTSIVALLAAGLSLGVSNAFNNLGLQAELSHLAMRETIGTAAGLFQTARFIGAALAGGLVGVIFSNEPTTDSLHRLSVLNGVLSLALLAWAAERAVAARAVVVVAHPRRLQGR